MKDPLHTNLKNELMSLNIMDKLDQNINSDPNTNYEILIMYANDTTLFSTFQSFKTSTKEVNVDTLINNELTKISEWLKINTLSLNESKSKYILYKTINKASNICA